MNNLSRELSGLREDDPDVALILETFRQIEHIYKEALEAMGVTNRQTPSVMNSAEITISFLPTASSSGY